MEIDTHLDAAVFVSNYFRMTDEERAFFSFLNACCETTPTAVWLWSKFPTLKKARGGLVDFVELHQKHLLFQYDVRWIRYKFRDVFNSYSNRIGERESIEEIKSASTGTGDERWYSFMKNFKIKMFGTYVFYLYTELLHYLCGLDIQAVLDPKTNHSVRSGLIYALGLEKQITCIKKGSKPTCEECEILRSGLEFLYSAVSSLNISDRHKTPWAIETTLCTYNKFNHGRRWLGFYNQRQKKELDQTEAYTRLISDNFDWEFLRDYRFKIFGER